MTLIEGVGDEVTHFFLFLLVLIVVYIAWWTTSTREHQHIRIFVLNGRQRNYSRLSSHVETATIMEGSRVEEIRERTTPPPPEEDASTSASEDTENKPATSSVSASNPQNGNASSEDDAATILRIMDQNVNTVRQRRLDRFEQRTTVVQSINIQETEGRANEVLENIETRVENVTIKENESDEKPDNNCKNEEVDVTAGGESSNNIDSSKITIKLKFLNDELKSVDGKLEEHLGVFKRRHFDAELSSNKIVRLIFNGQVLQQENATLASCGLFDNCVVHCLIHQKRTSRETFGPNRQDTTGGVRSGTPTSHHNSNNSPGRDWDLGNLLFFLICFILVTVWYFRYEYAHLYTVTATVALVVITGIFAVVMFGLYFPDREQTIPQAIH